MAEDPVAQDRLQPALLDRLTDEAPEAGTESRDRRVLSMQRLRAAVMRDLAWLLNTGHLETVMSLEDYPEARRSVLNYGIPDLSGVSLAGTSTAALERLVRQAIVAFEPRIEPKTLRVTIEADTESMSRNAMIFRIEGELWAKPAPQALYLKTEVDLETGDVSVNEERA